MVAIPTAAQGADRRIEQQGGADRLDQQQGDPRLLGLMEHLFAPVGGHYHRPRRRLKQGQPPAGFQAIDAGHLPIDKGRLERLALATGRGREGQRLLAGGRLGHHKTHLPQHGRLDLQGLRVIVHHQHAAVAQVEFGQQALHGSRRAHAQPGTEPEPAAPAQGAVHADLTAHQLGQSARNGQPQPGAAVFARGGTVGLLEGLEQPRLLFGRQADAGVLHLEAHQRALIALLQQLGADNDLTPFGELDRVIGVIDQHLPQAQRIAQQARRQFGVDIEDQLQALAGAFLADQAGQVFQHALQLEGDRLHLQLAGLDLAQVEDVVDQAEQMLARTPDFLHIIALFSAQFAAQHQVAHADHGIHRRADFMAHIGQEIRFQLRGVFGPGAGDLQFLFMLTQGLIGLGQLLGTQLHTPFEHFFIFLQGFHQLALGR